MTMLDELMRLRRRLQLAGSHSVQPRHWQPAADVYRTRQGWLVKLELAGVAPHEVEVETLGRLLRVRGRRRDIDLVQDMEFYSLEIAYSEFERFLKLPIDLERARVATEYRHGMLLVFITTEDASP